ncbi:glycosyltransferase family 10 domain-containing protein [Helicobacter cynogastricus]|uniref:glycosyltransferase family 10 domain-containing protein n=1 Tax=Helicobacter cynogastricus TaxID=329937 RepID=UPI000CF1AF38|nr:glycosyltransferase family 10 [Helicobacter cynogastricus]
MFAPLLEAFIDSSRLPPPPPNKKPLVLWIRQGENEADFKDWLFYKILGQRYNLSRAPNDYVCYLGGHHRSLEELGRILKIPTKRIAYIGENERIDFNVYDFGIGFDDLEFNDRYLRVPLYYQAIWWCSEIAITCANSPFKQAKLENLAFGPSKNSTPIDFRTTYPQIDSLVREQSDPFKREFASFVASNINAPVRNALYQIFNTYKPVAGGGGVFNTIGSLVQNKREFLSGYKFNLCPENSQGLGYTTEKIVDAYFAHTIPIYWGNPQVAKDFNPKSFVNVHDFEDFQEALDFVRYLDTHKNAYLDMLYSHPLNIYGNKHRFYKDLSFSKILSFLQNALECPYIYHECTNLINLLYQEQNNEKQEAPKELTGRQHLAIAFNKLLQKVRRVLT